ncbi:MAG: ABC transporter permease [Chloroflexi bacterium]|nr:ABC transporter permease [Chloroflexota bacterium]
MSATTENIQQALSPQAIKVRSLWGDAFRRLLRNKLAIVGLAVTLLFVLMAVFGPLAAPYDFRAQNFRRANAAPGPENLLGTDDLGRDVYSRILYGARTAITVGFFVTGIAMLIGIVLGGTSAYLGGFADWIVGRLIDVVQSIPGILFAILVNASIRNPSEALFKLIYDATKFDLFKGTTYVDYFITLFAISIVTWPQYARLIRGQILYLRATEYIAAAQAVGVPVGRILSRHIVPNALGPVIVAATFGFSTAMILEASLSYLGVGIQEPNPSWGAMISNNMHQLRSSPLLPLVPAAVLGIAALGINYLGDGLSDALNPRARDN